MKTISSAHIDNSQRNVGIDVGKHTLDVMVLETDTCLQEPNSPEGIKRLVSRLGRFKLTRIIVEATGGYGRCLVEACAEKAMPIIVIQPMQVRQFARAQGLQAKTDKLDARLIALFGAIIKPEPRPIVSKKNPLYQRPAIAKASTERDPDTGAEPSAQSAQGVGPIPYPPS